MLHMPTPMLMGEAASPIGQRLFLASGTFIVPVGVTRLCMVAIGIGGLAQLYEEYRADGSGGGGGLAYLNAAPVSPGEPLDVTITSAAIGAYSAVTRVGVDLVRASGAGYTQAGACIKGTGFSGGDGRAPGGVGQQPGGGAGGYTSAGGLGVIASSSIGGGGTSPYGGGAGAPAAASGSIHGALYGGGAGVTSTQKGVPGPGCVRFLWGDGRAFPNTNTGDL